MHNYARTGGILTIISSVFSLFIVLMGAVYIILPQALNASDLSAYNTNDLPPEVLLGMFTFIGAGIAIFGLVTGLLTVIGGIFALQKKHWGLALTGAICAAMIIFPIGIAATVLVSMARPEFSQQATQDMTRVQ